MSLIFEMAQIRESQDQMGGNTFFIYNLECPKYVQQVHTVILLCSQHRRICSYMCEIH